MKGSKIEWTDNTWQVTGGCSRVSPGCENCYAERLVGTRHRHLPVQATLTEIRGDGKPHWTNEIALYEKNLLIPLSWKEPCMIFVDSLSDLFHLGVPFDYIDRVYAIMALCPQHTFQLLTKRPDRMRDYLNDPDRDNCIATALGNMLDGDWIHKAGRGLRPRIERLIGAFLGEDENEQLVDSPMPLPNVWHGTSAENQKVADERLPILRQCESVIRFVSYEPALEGVDFASYLGHSLDNLNPVDLIIIGGESGPNARPFDIDWAVKVIEQCQSKGVAVFLKQLGAVPMMSEAAWFSRRIQRIDSGHSKPDPNLTPSAKNRHKMPPGYVALALNDAHGGNWDEWPGWLPRLREFPATAIPIHQKA